MHGLIHWLASNYAKKGITVNGVAPALIEDTKMVQAAGVIETMGPSKSSHESRTHGTLLTVVEIPVGRLGRSDEVAELVVYLIKSGYMTNKVIGVDGGLFVQ